MAPHEDDLEQPAGIDRDSEQPQTADVSRRDFLKTVGASGVATTIVARGVPLDGQAAPAQAPRRPAAAGGQAVDPRPYMRIRQEVAENLTKRGIVGYADRLRVQPGETIKFMVSSEQPRYRADIVRLIHGDANPKGPGSRKCVVETPANAEYAGKRQELPLGLVRDRSRSPGAAHQRQLHLHRLDRADKPARVVERFVRRLRRRADQMGRAERAATACSSTKPAGSRSGSTDAAGRTEKLAAAAGAAAVGASHPRHEQPARRG